jgi:hypothetical protein
MQEDEECSVLRWVAFEIVQACKFNPSVSTLRGNFQFNHALPDAKILYLD